MPDFGSAKTSSSVSESGRTDSSGPPGSASGLSGSASGSGTCGYCEFQWYDNGGLKWNLITNACDAVAPGEPPCECFPPVEDGAFILEVRFVDCIHP
jgi:hypothetical protein